MHDFQHSKYDEMVTHQDQLQPPLTPGGTVPHAHLEETPYTNKQRCFLATPWGKITSCIFRSCTIIS